MSGEVIGKNVDCFKHHVRQAPDDFSCLKVETVLNFILRKMKHAIATIFYMWMLKRM